VRTNGNGALVEIREVSKRFPGVQALDSVSLDIRPGEVHAVAGENGAGKSTLMKLLSQLERPSDGTIEIDGKPVQFRNPRHAQRLGIAMVHQEFALAPHLSVADNLALGREQTHAALIVRGFREGACAAVARVCRLGHQPGAPSIEPCCGRPAARRDREGARRRRKCCDHGRADGDATEPEIDELFKLIEELKADGIAILFHLTPARGGRADRRPRDGDARRAGCRDA
jgi:ribose transport system ATP-binding protein